MRSTPGRSFLCLIRSLGMNATANNGAMVRSMHASTSHDRTHWQHGPIDVVMDLHGSIKQIEAAKQALWLRFPQCLPELVGELAALRMNCSLYEGVFSSVIANRMQQAVLPFKKQFITPMAAVAGSVAQELLDIAAKFELSKIIVNNGGDVAIYGRANEKITVALLAPVGFAEFIFPDPAEYGVATSGWSGRSFSLGIADAVTVVAPAASQADAAATMIANAVGPQIQHSAIHRMPASSLKDDTDLGDQLVTTVVEALPRHLVLQALSQGEVYARELIERDLILSASLSVQGQSVIVTHSAANLAHFQSFQIKLAA
jgi:uncharacterized protein